MPGIKMLDERHKLLAEELLKGTPRSAIAKKIGVDRTTLYTWMKDPLWQEYFEKLARDLDEARSMRLLVTVMKLAEVTEAYLDIVLTRLQEGDVAALTDVPGLETITSALKRVAELEQQDARAAAGKPKALAGPSKDAEQRGAAVKDRLDRILAHPEETQH